MYIQTSAFRFIQDFKVYGDILIWRDSASRNRKYHHIGADDMERGERLCLHGGRAKILRQPTT